MVGSYSIESGSCRIDGGSISWLRSGAGPPLVLLHGIGSSALSWRGQLNGLSNRFDVIAWNAPGYGGSSHLQQDAPSVDDFADALYRMLNALEIERCHLVGHSLGSLIATRFALRHTERLFSLTLASCAIGHAGYEPALREQLLKSRLDDVDSLGIAGMATKRGPRLLSDAANEQMRRVVIDNMKKLDHRGYAQAARMLSKGDMLSDLRVMDPSLSVQIIYGLDDVITPPEVNEKVAAIHAHARVVRIPDAGHAVYVEQVEAFNKALADHAVMHHG